MDTPLHALAVPDADPATLKRPRDAARELVARIDRERAAAARGERVMKAADAADPAAARRAPPGRRCRAVGSRHARAHDLPDSARCPATWWSPTTPRPCRRASAAGTCRAARRSSCAWPDAPRSARRTRRSASAPSSSAKATSTSAPKTGRRRRCSRPAIGWRSGRSGRGAAHARPSAPGRDPLRRRRRRGDRRHRPARPAGAVRAPRRAARALGRVDADRRTAGRLRAAVGGLRARLAAARRVPPARHRLRDA